MKKRFVGICVLSSMFLISGCGQPDTSNMGSNDEAYSCGVWSIILHKDHRTVYGVKETGERDEFGKLKYKDTKKQLAGKVTIDFWGGPKETVDIDTNGYFRYGSAKNGHTFKLIYKGQRYYLDASPNIHHDSRTINNLMLINCKRVK